VIQKHNTFWMVGGSFAVCRREDHAWFSIFCRVYFFISFFIIVLLLEFSSGRRHRSCRFLFLTTPKEEGGCFGRGKGESHLNSGPWSSLWMECPFVHVGAWGFQNWWQWSSETQPNEEKKQGILGGKRGGSFELRVSHDNSWPLLRRSKIGQTIISHTTIFGCCFGWLYCRIRLLK